jgi:hypothetical protein
VRRRYLVIGAAVAAAAALGVGLWLGLAGGKAEPTREAFTAQASAACRSYARKLERVPAPGDPTAYGDVIASLRRAIPLLREQLTSLEALRAPRSLEPRLRTLFALDAQAIRNLQSALAAAQRREAGDVLLGLSRYTAVRDRSHALASAIGIRCNTH